MSSLGDYAMKAVDAGIVLVRLMKFLKSDDDAICLTRKEVEGIMMTIKEQSAALKQRGQIS